jgi:hypothetical protein
MSRNTKQLLTILVVAIVFCIVGGAAAIGGAGLIVDRFKDNLATDPEKIRQMAHEFINYELPPGYAEQTGMDFLIYKMILIGDSADFSTKPIIFLAHFEAENMTAEQMTQQMQKSMEQQSGNSGLKLKVVETRNVTINGKETPLTVSEGEDSKGTAYRQWVTAFPGKSGLVIILIQGPMGEWDNAVFNEFLSSVGF